MRNDATHIVLEKIREVRDITTAKEIKVVGAWVWISFPSEPSYLTRIQLKEIGFRYNKNRGFWQHPCGRFVARRARGYDPRDKYKVSDALPLAA